MYIVPQICNRTVYISMICTLVQEYTSTSSPFALCPLTSEFSPFVNLLDSKDSKAVKSFGFDPLTVFVVLSYNKSYKKIVVKFLFHFCMFLCFAFCNAFHCGLLSFFQGTHYCLCCSKF